MIQKCGLKIALIWPNHDRRLLIHIKLDNLKYNLYVYVHVREAQRKPSYFYQIVFSYNHCILLNFIPCNSLWVINNESWEPRKYLERGFYNVGLLCVFILLFSRFNSRSIFTSFKLIQDLAYSRVLIFMICICESLSHIDQNTGKPKPSTPSSPLISGLIIDHFRSDQKLK